MCCVQNKNQAFGGLPRLAKSKPVRSAAFLRIPARFIASVRSGPGSTARASSSAVSASVSRSSSGCGFLIFRAMRSCYLRCWWISFAVRCRTRDALPVGGAGCRSSSRRRRSEGVRWLRPWFRCGRSANGKRVVPRRKRCLSGARQNLKISLAANDGTEPEGRRARQSAARFRASAWRRER